MRQVNPMDVINYMRSYAQKNPLGNPEQEAREFIRTNNITQSQLNEVQQKATFIYNMMRGMGLIK